MPINTNNSNNIPCAYATPWMEVQHHTFFNSALNGIRVAIFTLWLLYPGETAAGI